MKKGDYKTIGVHLPGVVVRAINRAALKAGEKRVKRVTDSGFLGEVVVAALANEIEALIALEKSLAASVTRETETAEIRAEGALTARAQGE